MGELVSGAEPGGGGYIAQRIFSAKDEKQWLGATLWFNLAHYAPNDSIEGRCIVGSVR